MPYDRQSRRGEDHGWVANFAMRALLDKPTKVFETDLQVRDMLHVDDAAHAFLDWYRHDCPTTVDGAYNTCGGRRPFAVSIRAVLREISEYLNKPLDVSFESMRKGDLWWFVGNSFRAGCALDWTPTISFDSGVRGMIDWLRAHHYVFEE